MAWFTELCASIEAVVPEAGSVRSNLVCVPVVELGDLFLKRILSVATQEIVVVEKGSAHPISDGIRLRNLVAFVFALICWAIPLER